MKTEPMQLNRMLISATRFYTDIANYSVRINVPEGYRIAATGELGADGMYHAKTYAILHSAQATASKHWQKTRETRK